MTFSALTIVRRVPNKGWLCRCRCGRWTNASGHALTNGIRKSCGCSKAILNKTRAIKHGMSSHKLYLIWAWMWDRCTRKTYPGFKNYGGRGISVCKRWESFEAFRDDMLPTWRRGLTIHRKNNNGNYTPRNCVWATRVTQMNNTRRNHIITFRGRRLNIAQWAKKTGLPYDTLYQRMYAGWSPERMLTEEYHHHD